MARRGLGLDEGVGRRAGAEVEFLGGRLAVAAGLHVVDDVSGRGARGAVGGHDVLLRHDVVLGAGERQAVMRARLRDGRLALRLLVCDLDDGHGGGLLVVLGDLEADGLAVDGIGRHGGDFLDGVLA